MDIIGNVINPSLAGNKFSLKDAPALCSLRIFKIQRYLEEMNVDGVLAVNGVDSRYNPDSKRFINFILFGCSIYKTGSFVKDLDFDTDELILLIKPTKVHVYLNAGIMESIFPFLVKIHNLEIHFLDANTSVDENIIEDHKVYSFIAMTSDINNIALPYTSEVSSFDPMVFEKWPLIQAYALENYGSHGFFGLSHNLVGFDFENSSIFSQFDSGSLKHLLIDACILLKYQWNLMIKNVHNMTENQAGFDLMKATDPILTYLLHGGNNDEEVTFTLENHVITGNPVFVTCLIKEPRGSLGCGRTYFVHDNIDSSDLVLLSTVYDAMVATAHKTIQRFISTQSSAKLLQYFTKKFSDKLSTYKYPQLVNFCPKALKVNVSVEAFDVKGKNVDQCGTMSLKTFSVTIDNINSLENPKANYKSLVFKETFIDSHLTVKNEEITAVDTEFLVVTRSIPTHIQWNLHHKDSASGIPCSLFSNDSDTYEASFELNDSNIKITSFYSTPIHIRISDIRDVKIKKSGFIAIAVHLEHTSNCLPPFLKRFCLVFWQRGKGFKYAVDNLLPSFKEHDIPVKYDNVPFDIALKFENLVSVKSNPVDSSQDQVKLIESHYPMYSSFAPHFMLSSLGDFTYNQCDVNPNLTQPDTLEPFIFVTILMGIPGSNQEKICSLITESSRDENQFIVLRQPLGSDCLFNTQDLQKALQTLSQSGNNPIRVMVIVSAYIEIAEVVTAIVHHPLRLTRQSCHISCVNTCIDMRNMFISNRTWYPKIIEQCQEGWVNSIIVSGVKSSRKDEKLNLLRKINPNCNIIEVVGNTFIDAEGIQEICALDSFNEPPLPIARHLAAPGWYSLKYIPNPSYIEINYLTVDFDGELCKARFMSHLKNLHQKEGRVFVDRLVMSGSVFYLSGRTRFSDDSNTYNVECTPRSDAISLNIAKKPIPHGSKSCFIFTGYQITEKQVRNWLQGCVPKPPSKKEVYTKLTLTAEEKKLLKMEASKESLPEGWFYNGIHYVSMLEGKRMEHPTYDNVVQEYLAKKNKEVDEFNKQVDCFKVISLFDGM